MGHLALGALERSVAVERSILCVQPNAETQQFVREALADYRLVVIRTALDALRWTDRSTFDGYILDWWLPDWSGGPLCRNLLKSDPHVPVLFYSVAGEEYAPRALRAGAAAYFRPPLEAATLRERIASLIQTSDVRSLHASIAAERTIENELRRIAAARDTAFATLSSVAGLEARTKAKAVKAFLDSGGTRAYFDRCWPQQFAALCARHSLEARLRDAGLVGNGRT